VSYEIQYDDGQVRWHCLLTFPQQENRVIEWLNDKGVYAFYPVDRKVHIRRGPYKGKRMPDGRIRYIKEEKLLPGYVFAKFGGLPKWHIIREGRGISGVLGQQGKPFQFTALDLEALLEMRRKGEEVEEQETLVFKPGDQVQITEHSYAFDGFVREIAEVDAVAQTVILQNLDLLGKPVVVAFEKLIRVS